MFTISDDVLAKAFADSYRGSPDGAHLAGLRAVADLVAQELAKGQEPVAYLFQHEDTGQTMCVDVKQVEWGFEANNPRLVKVGPLYTRPVVAAPAGVPEGWKLVPVGYLEAVEKAAKIAGDYSPCIDAVEEAGGEAAEDPTWAIHHILYYAGFMLSAAPAAPADATPRLDKPAKVGCTRFGVGIAWSTVIGAAQRLYEFEVTPEKEAERIKKANENLSALRAAIGAAPADAVAKDAGWINPNNKTQARYLPNIGEPVLFCHAGKVYLGKHTGGGFKAMTPPFGSFVTWDCVWMYLPDAAIAASREGA
ncbi:hypothetical protein OTERR_12610 [Oryzomicrobium terrae]|uniref:Uncharacterized protein n=1 Tax=Oryzomicrobium terrae TaxID=1735038 RepID=A0A5C1E9B1_9RHOO|nr:hypothetical protein [Oryzomicrobium terrae]QEL64737.1 hypothetical protein OTERR_12610 [Oryzomicrobium terrae]